MSLTGAEREVVIGLCDEEDAAEEENYERRGRAAWERKCFKCLGADVIPFRKSARYLRAPLYLCTSCVKPLPTHKPNAEFDCGCTEIRSRGAVEKHWRAPWPNCPACRGTGKIRDKHVYLGKKLNIGATDSERGRHGHTAYEEESPIRAYFPDGGWQVWNKDWKGTTGRKSGRPPSTIHDLGVMKYYIADVANEVAAEYQEILSFEGDDFDLALTAVTDILFAKAKSANPRALGEWLPMSKATIYRRRKRGNMLLQHLGSIEKELQELNHKADLDQVRWIELFRRFGGLEAEPPNELEWEPETKP